MKKTKKGYGKKALSVSLSMALMLGGTAPVQAADLFFGSDRRRKYFHGALSGRKHCRRK